MRSHHLRRSLVRFLMQRELLPWRHVAARDENRQSGHRRASESHHVVAIRAWKAADNRGAQASRARSVSAIGTTIVLRIS